MLNDKKPNYWETRSFLCLITDIENPEISVTNPGIDGTVQWSGISGFEP